MRFVAQLKQFAKRSARPAGDPGNDHGSGARGCRAQQITGSLSPQNIRQKKKGYIEKEYIYNTPSLYIITRIYNI